MQFSKLSKQIDVPSLRITLKRCIPGDLQHPEYTSAMREARWCKHSFAQYSLFTGDYQVKNSPHQYSTAKTVLCYEVNVFYIPFTS